MRQRGYKGARPPMTTVEIDGHRQQVQISDDAAAICSPKNQLVLVDSSGDEHYVPLFRGMSADDLRAKIQKTGITQTREYRLHCDEEASDEFLNLIREVFPRFRVEELPATNAGTRRGTRTVFQFGEEDYFRAVARIALHYYLAYNEREFRGDEPCFREIRRFIRHGAGNHEQFFRPSGGGLVTRHGEALSGEAILPGECCHVLAALEANNAITVYLQFYLGLENNPEPDYITLAEIESPGVLPRRAWGHVYQIEHGRKDHYAGRVVPATIMPLS
jgi:hypothetical protein